MSFDSAWEIFSKIIWPIIVAYALYLHRELSTAMVKIEALQRLVFDHKTEAHKLFVTQEVVTSIESKLGRMLERIDDKITRILENKDKS
jgi:hypothetical protein